MVFGVVVLIAVLAWQQAVLVGVRREVEDLRRSLARALEEMAALRATPLGTRGLDTRAVAMRSLPSVFTLQAGSSTGSGFVVRSAAGSSLLLTNAHVVRGAERRAVEVRKGDALYPGRVIASDPQLDIAVVEVRAALRALPIHLGPVLPGDPVVVIGSPLGLEGSVTTGVVSRVEPDVLQISAPVNPGNSGGPVLNAEGRVVGVASAKLVGVAIEGIGIAVRMGAVCERFRVCE